jgi:glutamine amidotransferase
MAVAKSRAMFHSATPAWGDRNLHTLASEISSPLFLAHVRAATGMPVQETNCHPFAHVVDGDWGVREPAAGARSG